MWIYAIIKPAASKSVQFELSRNDGDASPAFARRSALWIEFSAASNARSRCTRANSTAKRNKRGEINYRRTIYPPFAFHRSIFCRNKDQYPRTIYRPPMASARSAIARWTTRASFRENLQSVLFFSPSLSLCRICPINDRMIDLRMRFRKQNHETMIFM